MNSNLTDKKEIRKFGLIALLVFGSLFSVGLWFHKIFPICLFGTLATLGLGFIIMPEQLRPVHAGWLKTAHFIGRVITTVVLIIAYYLVITPSALLKRIIGGRPLPLKPERESTTYWVERKEKMQPKERFIKRY
jgi:hypothetical protein